MPILTVVVLALLLVGQGIHEAPAHAPPDGRLAPAGEAGERITVSGIVVNAEGVPVRGASLYVYQTDREGYYGVKPASDNRNPRLKPVPPDRRRRRVVVRDHPSRLVSRLARAGPYSLRGLRPRPRPSHGARVVRSPS